MTRVLSLNITNGGQAIHQPFLASLEDLAPDLITLQEVRRDTAAAWCAPLAAAGYQVVDTFEIARELGTPHPGPFRMDGLMIASRWAISPLDPLRAGLPWPERLLSVTADHPTGPFELHTVHVPNASTGISLFRKGQREAGRERLMKKLETFEGVHRALTQGSELPRILTGDFNTPHTESTDGRVRYWEHSCPAALRPELAARWLSAERSVIEGLGEHGLRDAFRTAHGYVASAFSWEHGSSKNRCRYDHVFASSAFDVIACDYLHEFRIDSSHHAAIVADLSGP
ncbi:MAG: hypothetical protein H0X64_03365 [Gemmatimonadaceae bacterium]|nr:hypothetical protein [Gemmatimonadaceae bacterium]